MELRQYFRVILRSWWLVIPLTLTAITLTLLFSYTRTPIYEATSRYVIALNAPRGVDLAELYYIIDSLAGRQQIGVNFCSAITSGDTLSDSLDVLGITEEMIFTEVVNLAKYKFSCNVLPESTVLLLSVQGPSPEIVYRLNETLGVLGTQRSENIYQNLVTLNLLDAPYLEPEPISPNHITNGVLGTALGIVVSLTTALLLDYVRSPLERMESTSIRDSVTNAYNDRYFQKRLAEEVERSKQRNRPISIGLLQIFTNEDFSLLPESMRDRFLHQAALFILDKVRQGDIVAYRGNMQFEILLPETPGYEARSQLTVVAAALRSHLFRDEQYTTTLHCKIGLVESAGDALGKVDLLKKAEEALIKSEESKTRHVYLMSTISSAFVLDEETEFQLNEVVIEDRYPERFDVPASSQQRKPAVPQLFSGDFSEPEEKVSALSTDYGNSIKVDTQEMQSVVEQLGLQPNLPPDDPFFDDDIDNDNNAFSSNEFTDFSSFVNNSTDYSRTTDSDIATPYYDPSFEESVMQSHKRYDETANDYSDEDTNEYLNEDSDSDDDK